MSRVGKRPVAVEKGVTATLEGQTVKMKEDMIFDVTETNKS